MASVRLAEGNVAAAVSSIRNVLGQAGDSFGRSRVLDAYVEVMLANDDIPAARDAAAELGRFANRVGSIYLQAVAGRALGATLLAGGEAQAGLAELRRARATWAELGVPYELAKTRLLIRLACRETADVDSATMEIDSARKVFESLGAATDLGLDRLTRAGPPRQ